MKYILIKGKNNKTYFKMILLMIGIKIIKKYN